MDIKKYEGSLSFDDFEEGLVSRGCCKSFGEVWEKCVTCNHCKHQVACDTLCNQLDSNLSCSQVIDILLGQVKIEDILKGGTK